jgi:CBS domain-containing protein
MLERRQGAEQGRWEQVLSGLKLVSVRPSVTLEQLLQTLVESGLHRVYVTDDENKPLGVSGTPPARMPLVPFGSTE